MTQNSLNVHALATAGWPTRQLLEHPHPGISQLSHGPEATPAFASVTEAFEHQVRVHPEVVAARHGDQQMTYAELDRHAEALAQALTEAGVRPGDAVGVFVVRSLPMLVGILAVLKVGAAYVPQDIRITPPATLARIVGHAQCRVVLCMRGTARIEGLAPDVPQFVIEDVMTDRGEAASTRPQRLRPAHPAGLCMILFTSGTTGTPNAVQVSHDNLCNLLLTAPGNLGMRPGLRTGQMMNIAFDMAAWEILGALCNGATLVIRGSDLQACAEQVEVLIATPAMLARIDPDRCTRVQVVAVAGETCPEALAQRWSARCRFYNGCGPTETTIVNTLHPFASGSRSGLVPIGRPTPNNTVYVLDDDLQPCDVGVPGELWAGGRGITRGYLDDPGLTQQRYRPDPFLGDGWLMFRTRDLARWNADGNLEHLGRVDDQVKIQGFRVELEAISRLLERLPDVDQAVTLKTPDNQLAAFVSPDSVNVERATRHLQKLLPYYSVPQRVTPLPRLPLTPRGKIDRAPLQRMAATAVVADTSSSNDPEGAEDPLPAPLPLRRRWLHLRLFSHYNRLFALVCVLNVCAALLIAGDPLAWSGTSMKLLSPPGLVVLNIVVAVLMRQSLVINGLFRLATRAPLRWPLAVRRELAKVYHFGGLHTGSATAALAWLLLTVVLMLRTPGTPTAALASATALLLLWTGMALTALPPVRRKMHNLFEHVHRFAGWSSLVASAWLVVALLPAPQGLDALLHAPAAWLLLLATASVLLPWLGLRRVPVRAERLSTHAVILHLARRRTPFPGSSNAIARSPLGQWHGFACIPSPGKHPFRLIVSRAGDWTGELIDSPPAHVWIRGFTTAGVANVETLFRSVVYVATGSGIGPVLPHLLAGRVPARLVWSARSPRQTYGDGVVEEILQAVPDALIWDTAVDGKPDLLALAWRLARQSGAEAVICISNQRLTQLVVEGCEARGLPAYGAIWDS